MEGTERGEGRGAERLARDKLWARWAGRGLRGTGEGNVHGFEADTGVEPVGQGLWARWEGRGRMEAGGTGGQQGVQAGSRGRGG